MKDKKLRKLSNYWMATGDLDLAEEFAQEILDPDLRDMQLDRITTYEEQMQDIMNGDDDDIPPPNYSKKSMANYCLGNVTPFSCEQTDDTPFVFPVSSPWSDPDRITKNDTVLVMVECDSQFRQRYVIEVDAEYPEYALDDVAMGRCKEFSQSHLGEVVVSQRVISVDEVLAICDEDNAYVKSWSDEKKLQMFVTETTYHGDEQ